MRIEDIAQICHDANRAYCHSHGDVSQRPWNIAEQWQRDSAINGVRFALENPNASPRSQHEAWMNDKINDGWKYGETKDAEAKTHPCLVEYADLPEHQKLKDELFQAIVRVFKAKFS